MSLVRISWALLLSIGLISVFFISQLPKLEFDYEFESFFPTGDPDLEFYLDFRKEFEPDNDFVFIALENDAGIFDSVFLAKSKELCDSIKRLEYVQWVKSPLELSNPVISPLGEWFDIPWLHSGQPSLYRDDSVRIYNNPQLAGIFFSRDAKALNIVIKNTEYLAKKKSDQLLKNIEHLLESKFRFDNSYVTGRIHAQHYFIEKMKSDVIKFFFLSLLLVVVLLTVAFRSFWGVVVPVVIVIISTIWLLGIMVLMGQKLNLLTTILPTIIFIVGMSDIVHLLSKYLEELRNDPDKISAIKKTIRNIGLATFYTSLTTAVGFMTFITSGIQPVSEFGIYTSLGILIAFVLTYLILPPVLVLIKKPNMHDRINRELGWQKNLHSIYRWLLRNRKNVMIVTGIITVISIVFAQRIKVNNYLLEEISESEKFKQNYLYFEKNFSGVRPFEMGVWVKDTTRNLLDYEVMKEFDKLENYLNIHYGAGAIISPLAVVKSAYRAINGGHQNYYRLPDTKEQFDEVVAVIKKYRKKTEMKRLLANDMHLGRITGRVTDHGGHRFAELNKLLDDFFRSNINTSLIGYKVTGTATLIDKNNDYLVGNILGGLAVAVIIIVLIAATMFRSLKMLIIVLIPNIVPLLMIVGIMGFCGIDLKISTAMIFTISFGIAVDDTIHYIARMKVELNNGKSWLYAVKRTYLSTGKAIFLTTFILSGGFLTLLLSDFSSTFNIGLLISLTLIFAVLGDMILLPVLLLIFIGKRKK